MFYFKVEEGQGKVTLDICLQSNLQTKFSQLNLELRHVKTLKDLFWVSWMVIILFGPVFLSWISPQIKLIITDDMPERKFKFTVQICENWFYQVPTVIVIVIYVPKT